MQADPDVKALRRQVDELRPTCPTPAFSPLLICCYCSNFLRSQIDTEVKAVRRQVEELRPKAEALEELRKELALMQQQVGRVGCWPWGSCAGDWLLCSSRWGRQQRARGAICRGGAGRSACSCSSGWGGRSCVQRLGRGVGCRGAAQATSSHAAAGEVNILMCNDAGGVLAAREVQVATRA